MRPQIVYIFILRLSAQPFLGLVGEAASPPIRLYPHSGAAGICPFKKITRCIQEPWIFARAGFSSGPNIDNLLRSLLRSWGSFGCSISPTFLEGVLKLSGFFPIVPAQSGVLILSNILGGICSCCRYLTIWPLVWQSSCGILLVPQFPVVTGAQKFLEGLLWSIPVNIITAFFFPRLTMEKALTVCFHSLQRAFFSRLSSCSVRKERKK